MTVQTTTRLALPYYQGTDPPHGASQQEALAKAIDTKLGGRRGTVLHTGPTGLGGTVASVWKSGSFVAQTDLQEWYFWHSGYRSTGGWTNTALLANGVAVAYCQLYTPSPGTRYMGMPGRGYSQIAAGTTINWVADAIGNSFLDASDSGHISVTEL